MTRLEDYGLGFRVYGLLRASARRFRWSRGLSGHIGRASLRSHDFKLLCLNSVLVSHRYGQGRDEGCESQSSYIWCMQHCKSGYNSIR